MQVFLLASTACITLSVQVGLTRNAVVTHAQEVACLKWYMIAQALLIVSSMIGRVAFIMYLRRLIPVQSKTRAVLFVLLALQPCVNVVPILLMFLQCKEFAAVFDHTITNVHCLPVVIQINFGFFQGGPFSIPLSSYDLLRS